MYVLSVEPNRIFNHETEMSIDINTVNPNR